MAALTLDVAVERFPIAGTFAISRGAKTEAVVVVVRLEDGTHRGRGECVPYARYGETVEGVRAAVEAMEPALAAGLDRAGLQDAMAPGAARNALDCAFWDLEAKRAGARVWDVAGLAAPKPVQTVYTLSLDTPEKMGEAAAAAGRPLLKLKLTGAGDLDRVKAVRANAPGARLVVDANEAWTPDIVAPLSRDLAALGVEMIEQPLPAGSDAVLADFEHPVPLCADESAHDRASLAGLAGRYEMINIKLDKTGGLTEALALKDAAEAAGFQVMVGCMVGSSLSMAPGHLVAQGAAVVDLDAPLWLARDRPDGMVYQGAMVEPPSAALWG